MVVEYSITIEGETHHIRVAVRAGQNAAESEDVKAFVVATAYLEHFGYLPRGVVNAVD